MAEGTDILIVGPNWVGDMVMAEPLVAALKKRWPDQSIDILAPPGLLEVARRMRGVRATIPLPFSPHIAHMGKRYRLGRELRGRYADAYVLPGSFVSALIPAFGGIARRHGYLRELRFGLINRIVGMPRGEKRRTAAAYLRLAGESGVSRPQLLVDLENQARVLRSFGLNAGAFAILMPGAAGGPAKRWSAASFGDLAQMLAMRGTPVVILGGPEDKDVTAAVASLAPSAFDLGGRTNLTEAIDLIAAAQVAIANDTGPMHIAAAVGVPTIGIYGSTSPDDTPPLADAAAVVTHRISCSPCNQRICPLGHTRCLTAITPGEVLATLDQLRPPRQALA